jgi:hypothetical protein
LEFFGKQNGIAPTPKKWLNFKSKLACPFCCPWLCVYISDDLLQCIGYLLFSDGYIGLNSFGFGGSNGHVILKPFKRKRKEMGLSICQMFHE